MRKDFLHFEESVVDGFDIDFNKLERPLDNVIFMFLAGMISLIFLVTIGQILFLAVGKKNFYEHRAAINMNKLIISPAQRGIITDRFDKPLLKNLPSFSVLINLGIILKKDDLQIEQTAQKLGELLNIDSAELVEKIKKINLESNNKITVARDVTLEQVINLKTLNLKGVEVSDDYKRNYIDSEVFSHVLGYVGIGDKGEIARGVTGIESYYDEFLQGQNGEFIVLKDVKENDIDKKALTEARPGHKLITSIDADFQKYFYNRLKLGLEQLGRKSGVGLAINPQTGEILSLISLPGFSNNNPAEYLNRGDEPLFNRAISGLYNPGSTIKPLVALAALKEKIITPNWEIYSKGYLELANPYNPDKPSRFLDWKAHGWVDLYSALARSSNIYFYAIGGGCLGRIDCESRPLENINGLGIDKLKEYWKFFGLNESTGVDLVGEGVGFLPDADEKETRTGQIWRIGDTYNVSIGQGDLSMTPIRLLAFISSLANNGKLLQPFLVKQIINDKGGLIKENKPEELLDYSDWFDEIKGVQKGMRDAVAQPYGTANMLYDLPYKTAGKTGSAQIKNNTKTNAFFVGYGPYEKPQIAILVLVEDAKEGSINTLPIAYDVLKWYYENRL